MNRARIGWIAAAAVAVLVTNVWAQDHQHGETKMSAEEQAMMDAMMKAATPGPQHAWLAKAAGSFDFKGKFWMASGTPPSESTGTAERTSLLGTRVLQETISGNAPGMPMPFEGMGWTGYDNVSGKWWGTWTDSMGTGLMLSEGTCDDAGKCEFKSSYNDPLTGKPHAMRMVSWWQDADHETVHSFDVGPDGKEFLNMELHYTRKK
jgi:Protein of unknown function (DUF1579)